MQDQPAPSQDGATAFTLREAAEALGISLNTLRRRIAAGQVQAEKVDRPQGHVWQVWLHRAGAQQHRADGTVQQDGAETVQQPPQALMQAEAMAAYTRSILEPLVQTIERQADQLVSQAETIGRLTAQNQALVASGAAQPVEPATATPQPRWRALMPWALAVLAIVVAGLLLTWPR